MRALLIAALVLLIFTAPAWGLQATVTWTDQAEPDPANEETGFRVERRDGVDASPWVAQATTAANVTTFNQTGLALGTRYCYRVTAVNAFADGTPSAPSCGTPDAPIGVGGVTVIFGP